MNISLEVSYKSLCKQGEELCGDKLEIIKTEDSDIIILSDGMGSGVKANILATLTSKILGTMLRQGARLEDCVDTIAKTLPVCSIRKVAYSTFSILQIFGNGKAYLVEYDNPGCVFVRGKKIMNIPYRIKNIEDKTIREFRCAAGRLFCAFQRRRCACGHRKSFEFWLGLAGRGRICA